MEVRNTAAKVEHLGIKYLHLIIFGALALVWTLWQFFQWFTAIEAATFTNFFTGLFGLFLYLLVVFIWQLAWHYFGKVTPLIVKDYKPVGFKTLFLTVTILLGIAWQFFNFIQWIIATTITTPMLVFFGQGLVMLSVLLLVLFVVQVLWAVAHRVSDL